MVSYTLIQQWIEAFEDSEEKDLGYTLDEYLEECEIEYCKARAYDAYFYEIDPMQSANEGYMESHRREW